MGRDQPPQTVLEAIEFGWTHLSFECRNKRCNHAGRVPLMPYILRSRFPLGELFERCKCGACGRRPTTASLAFEIGPGHWHEKRIDFFEGMVIRPSRE